MRQLFEVFSACGEDWLRSSVVLEHRSVNSNKVNGRFVWRTVEDLAKECLVWMVACGLLIPCYLFKQFPKPENPKTLNPKKAW